jgi:peptidoglycan/LPS O-acetylase OafA/YrhL
MLFHLGLNTVVAGATGGRVHDGAWPLAVDFFFILSGFVLSLSYGRRPVSVGDFARKRVLRLAPMFVLTTAAMIPLTTNLPIGAALANLLMLQPFFGLPSINMPAWSVPFEAWLPLIAVAVATALPRMGRRMQIAALAIALAVQAGATLSLTQGADHQLWRSASGLVAGALLQQLYVPGSGKVWTASACFAGGVLVMALAGILPWLGVLFPLCAAGAIWFGAEAKGLFSTAPLQALGRWSFSIYLLHIPVLALTERLIGGVDGSIALKAAIVLAVLILSAICYRWIESPIMALGKPRAAVAA